MKCPDCENGKRPAPACVRWAPGKKPTTEDELRQVLEAMSKCTRCNGTGEIPDEYRHAIERGEQMRKRRIGLGFGLREAAEIIGIMPSILSGMEQGRVAPVLELLDRLPVKA